MPRRDSSPARTPRTSPTYVGQRRRRPRARSAPQLAAGRPVHARSAASATRLPRPGPRRHGGPEPRPGAPGQGRGLHRGGRSSTRTPRSRPGYQPERDAADLRAGALAAGPQGPRQLHPAERRLGLWGGGRLRRARARRGHVLGRQIDDHVRDRERDLVVAPARPHRARATSSAPAGAWRRSPRRRRNRRRASSIATLGSWWSPTWPARARARRRDIVAQRAVEPLAGLGDRAVDVVGEVLEPRGRQRRDHDEDLAARDGAAQRRSISLEQRPAGDGLVGDHEQPVAPSSSRGNLRRVRLGAAGAAPDPAGRPGRSRSPAGPRPSPVRRPVRRTITGDRRDADDRRRARNISASERSGLCIAASSGRPLLQGTPRGGQRM